MTEHSKKKLVLVYPPFTTSTSPPLGVCMLKGHLQQAQPDWSVRVCDLNLLTHQQLFRALSGRPLERKSFPEGPLAEIALLRAEQVFRGLDPTEFYDRPDHYTVYGDLFLRVTENEVKNAAMLEGVCRNGGPLPGLIEEQADLVLNDSPDAVGVSLCYSQQAWYGLALARAIKRRRRIPLIFGGTYFNDGADRLLRDFGDVVDFIVCGEGERTLAALLGDLGKPQQVPGLIFRNGQDRRTAAHLEEDLDNLGHPDYSDLLLESYYSPQPVLPMLTSRGCYWRRCAFCVHYQSAGLTYRRHSVGYVLDELKRHVARGITHFAFIDEMLSPAHFAQLARGITEAGLQIGYYALAKPVKQFTREMLRLIVQSGCKYILWGVESASQRVLDLMEKGTCVADVARVLQDAHAVGLFNHVYIMPGFPTETRDEFVATLCFLEENKQVIAAVHRGLFRLEKGSPVFDNPARYLITDIRQVGSSILGDSYEYICQQGMNASEARQLFSQALPFLREFNPYSRCLGNFRDHALLLYSQRGGQLRKRTVNPSFTVTSSGSGPDSVVRSEALVSCRFL